MIKKIIGRIATFNRVMFIKQRLFKQPAQTAKEIKVIKKLFELFKGKKISIFEYGCGYSTIYFARYLRSKKYKFEWRAIDNSDTWFYKVRDMLSSQGLNEYVFLNLRLFKPFFEKPEWDFSKTVKCEQQWQPTLDAEKDYIDFPKRFPEKFDIIFVDGRFRRRCLLVIKECLKKGGVVVLHDAQKEHYHSSLKHYPYQIFINGGRFYPNQEICNAVWFGSNDNSNLTKTLKKS